VRRLVLVRHGESLWNAEDRVQGQRCAGLSPLGLIQAAHVGRVLAAAYPQAQLVASDLQRTVETARPLAAALGIVPRTEPRLRERSFGLWEGRLREEVVAEYAARWERWRAGDDVLPEVGGESDEQVNDRVVTVLAELLDSTADGGVTIAVTHAGPVWYGTQLLLGLPRGTLGYVENASVTELIAWEGRSNGGAALQRWNEVGHLPLESRTG
jgi:glucosyl-3-phosphoglycerate phosphatase